MWKHGWVAQCAYHQLHRAVHSKTKAQFLNHTSSVSGIHSCAYPEQYRHKMVLLSKVVLNCTVGAMTEQLRIAGNRWLRVPGTPLWGWEDRVWNEDCPGIAEGLLWRSDCFVPLQALRSMTWLETFLRLTDIIAENNLELLSGPLLLPWYCDYRQACATRPVVCSAEDRI